MPKNKLQQAFLSFGGFLLALFLVVNPISAQSTPTDLNNTDQASSTTDSYRRAQLAALAEDDLNVVNDNCQAVVVLAEPDPVVTESPVTTDYDYLASLSGPGRDILQSISDFYARHQATITAAGHVTQVTTLAVTGISVFLYALSAFLQASQILTVGTFTQVLIAFGLIKVDHKAKGIVVDSQNYEPIPYALLTINSAETADRTGQQKIQETIISGQDGMFQGIELPPGMYQLRAQKEGYAFPTVKERSPGLTINDFYRGEFFNVTSNLRSQQMIVPLDNLSQSSVNPQRRKKSFRTFLHAFSQRLNKAFRYIMITLWILSLLTVILTPTWFNIILLITFTIAFIITWSRSLRRPRVSGWVDDESDKPLAGVIIRLNDIESNQLVAVTQSDDKGKFAFYVEPGLYQLSAVKNEYSWVKAGGSFALQEIDVTGRKREAVNIQMRRSAQTIEEFFAK